jgi:GTP-binding protein
VQKIPNYTKKNIRNVAVIAHVDHGKTTLIDAFFKQTHLFRDNQEEMRESRLLDSNELEKEKGITILSKIASIIYKKHKINIVDTPGHADFGGEVERTLNMADGCILVVDAQEGVMPQTEFVLRKAFENGLKIIVLINKIDKKLARIKKVEEEISDLFLNLAVDEDQLDFPVLYGIAVDGKVFRQVPDTDLTVSKNTSGDVTLLLDAIIETIPEPKATSQAPFKMQISLLDYDSHIGRYLIGKVRSGQVKINDKIKIIKKDEQNQENVKVTARGEVRSIYTKIGMEYKEISQASAGDIVAIAGIESTAIGATLCTPDNDDLIEPIKLSPPAVSVQILANNSPLVGQEGKFVTSGQLDQRIEKEKRLNIGLDIEKVSGGYKVTGRGELQLSILFETMRREGYEFQVKSPEIIMKKENGKIMEPLEKLFIDVPEEYMGLITNTVNERNGELVNIRNENGNLRFIYRIRTRDFLGLRNSLISSTRGTAVLNSFITDYVEFAKSDTGRKSGVLISMENGISTGYALNMIQQRGDLFIKPGTEVYEGMIIGINKYERDMEVNPTKSRNQSNVRMKHDEITQTSLKPVIPLTLEYALVFINKDEMIEITPKSIRLRKIHLSKNERKRAKKEEIKSVQ